MITHPSQSNLPGAKAPDQAAPGSGVVLAEPGFGIYVHWPFCAQKCPYCDFNSHVRHGGWDEARFLAAYLAELRAAAERLPGRTVSSIFFGGGTPSLMQPATVGAILDAVARHWPLEPGAEITLEANPSSVEVERFRGYRTAGVNRVSLGVQALHDAELKRLGRLHNVAEALRAIDIAKATFERVSFDLIYARPGMTEAAWEAELARALALAVGHISLYQLTIEDGTPFAALHKAGKLIVPEPELADRLFEITQAMTEAAGLPAYEISNHARPGEESRHNLVYWRYGDYAGIGPGAHGREQRPEGRFATVAEKMPEAWAALVERQGHGLIEATPLTRAEQADELLLMGLRLTEGVDLERLARLGGVMPAPAAINRLVALGMLDAPRAGRLRATRAGRFVLNELVVQLSRSFVAAT